MKTYTNYLLTRYDFPSKWKQRCDILDLDESIINAGKPIIDILEESKNWAFSKDPHSDNWLLIGDVNENSTLDDAADDAGRMDKQPSAGRD